MAGSSVWRIGSNNPSLQALGLADRGPHQSTGFGEQFAKYFQSSGFLVPNQAGLGLQSGLEGVQMPKEAPSPYEKHSC